MAVNGFTNIVTNGLVLNLDAGNLKSYPTTGTTWTNLTKDGNNGTINNCTFDSSNLGSLLFNGSTSYVNTTDLPFRFDTTFTLSVWFYWDGVSVSKNIISKRNGSPYNQYSLFIANDINGNPGNKINFFAREDGSAGLKDTLLSYTMTSTGFYNVFGVMNTTTQSLYVNGTLISSSSNNYTSNSFNIINRTLLVGAAWNDTYNGILSSFNNKIYQVQIYNRALSSSEVLQNYNATKWRFI